LKRLVPMVCSWDISFCLKPCDVIYSIPYKIYNGISVNVVCLCYFWRICLKKQYA
jgi:hypothetical protein